MTCSTRPLLASARFVHPLVAPTLVALLAASGCDRTRPQKGGGAGTATSGAVPSDAELDAPIATIDGEAITVREFQDRINQQTPYVRARYNSIEQKKEFLDS